jgi:hypothetical protein
LKPHAPYCIYRKQTKAGCFWYVRYRDEASRKYTHIRSTGIPVKGRSGGRHNAEETARVMLKTIRFTPEAQDKPFVQYIAGFWTPDSLCVRKCAQVKKSLCLPVISNFTAGSGPVCGCPGSLQNHRGGRGAAEGKGILTSGEIAALIQVPMKDPRTSHSLRHTYITIGRLSGISDMEIRALAGHRAGVMTEQYSHAGQVIDFNGVRERLQKVIGKQSKKFYTTQRDPIDVSVNLCQRKYK